MILIGNWKMAPNKKEEATLIAKSTLALARKYKNQIQTIICPSFIHLNTVNKFTKDVLFLGAQDISESVDIAQTGNTSVSQVYDSGVKYVLVGHSELRARGETNVNVFNKAQNILNKKMIPVVCIGEKERDAQGWYLSEVKDQIEVLLHNLSRAQFKKIIIAYEPVWAIGKDAKREATPVECREMVIYVRKLINDFYGDRYAKSIKILYGGSVNEDNAKSFVLDGGVDGLLVGRVSLDIKRFSNLIKNLV